MHNPIISCKNPLYHAESHYIIQMHINYIMQYYIISKQSTISFRNPLHHEFIHYIINKHTTSCKNYIKSEQSTISFRHSLLYHAKTHYIIQHSLSCRNYMHLFKARARYTTQPSFSHMLKIKSSTILHIISLYISVNKIHYVVYKFTISI